MNFNQKLKSLVNKSEVPECLSPENISIMLRNKMAEKNRSHVSSAISMKPNKRVIIMRYSVAVVACLTLVFGVVAFANNEYLLPTNHIHSDHVIKEAQDYAEVYKVLLNNFVKYGTTYIEKVDNSSSPDKNIENTTKPEIINRDGIQSKVVEQVISPENAEDSASPDILKTDGSNLYYMSDESLNVFSADNGKLTKILDSQNEDHPETMFVEGNKLVAIYNSTTEVPYEITVDKTEETATSQTTTESKESLPEKTEKKEADSKPVVSSNSALEENTLPETVSQKNTIVKVYDISDKNNVSQMCEYKQNGYYVSSKIVDNTLLLVTNHSNYNTKPLNSQSDVDNYIPAFYVNGEKKYIDPSNIFISESSNSTSFMIASSIKLQDSVDFTSIKAVLFDSDSAYFTDKSVYVMGPEISEKQVQNTGIVKFDISGGNMSYSSKVKIDGQVVNKYAMNEYNDKLAIVMNVQKGASSYAEMLILDKDLQQISRVPLSEKAVSVKFDKTNVYVTLVDGKTFTINVSDASSPSSADSKNTIAAASTFNLYDNVYIGIGLEYDKDDKFMGTKVSSYTLTDGNFKETSSVMIDGKVSESNIFTDVIDGKSIYKDSELNIGIPTYSKNQYGCNNNYNILAYDTTSKQLNVKNTVQYKDINDVHFNFKRSVSLDNILYIFSDARVVSSQMSDGKIIENIEN